MPNYDLENFDALMSSIPPVIHLTVLPLLTFIGLIYTSKNGFKVNPKVSDWRKGRKLALKITY